MGFMENINPAYVGVFCALLCAGLVVIGFVLQAVGGFLDIFFRIFEVLIDILQGGPIAWCGCLVVMFGCIGCSGFVFLVLNASASCAQYPTNFCRWFGLG